MKDNHEVRFLSYEADEIRLLAVYLATLEKEGVTYDVTHRENEIAVVIVGH